MPSNVAAAPRRSSNAAPSCHLRRRPVRVIRAWGISCRMPVLGQKRRFHRQSMTSGLPRTTDIIRPVRLVRFVPDPDSCNAANSRLRRVRGHAHAAINLMPLPVAHQRRREHNGGLPTVEADQCLSGLLTARVAGLQFLPTPRDTRAVSAAWLHTLRGRDIAVLHADNVANTLYWRCILETLNFRGLCVSN
jgi:hypothetical protein